MSATGKESAAIVLDIRDHGESDKIATLMTSDYGRITGIAKGANRSKKRFLNKLELFTLLRISFSENNRSSLVFLSEAELISSFINLRSDVVLYNAASLIRETILIATMDRQEEYEIFDLLHWALASLDRKNDDLPIIAIFLLRFYDIIGYRPDFSSCSFCNDIFSIQQSYGFHLMAGGLICGTCMQKRTENTSPLANGTIRLLTSVAQQPIDKLHRLQFSRRSLMESLDILHRYGRHLFQRETHSWKAVRQALNDDNI